MYCGLISPSAGVLVGQRVLLPAAQARPPAVGGDQSVSSALYSRVKFGNGRSGCGAGRSLDSAGSMSMWMNFARGANSRVRPAGEVHPHRHRPCRDLQERPGAHPDRRRRQEDPAEADARVPRARDRLVPPRRLVAAHRGLAGEVPADLRGLHRRRDQAAVHDRGDGQGRAQRDHHLGRRPAPDVGGAALPVHAPAPVAQLRRPRDDGLRAARGDRRQGRLPRPGASSASPATARSS